MSEFDAAGFSAIDQFFGDGGKESKEAGTQITTVTSASKGTRRGVGSSVPSNAVHRDLTSKFLAVGRKRRRGDEDNEDVHDANSDADEDDEEEAGRTAIAEPSNTSRTDSNTSNTPEPKQKLGGKERKGFLQPTKEDGSAKENSKTSNDAVVDGDVQTESVKKYKRRKIRSKQKNIRKDNREQKPAHLMVGGRNYQGRPITVETRTKLNLPAPKARMPFSTDESHEEDHGEVEAGGLALDDLLKDDPKHGVTSPPSSRAKGVSKKNKSKPKYKNLKV
jgi:hypothetical protein